MCIRDRYMGITFTISSLFVLYLKAFTMIQDQFNNQNYSTFLPQSKFAYTYEQALGLTLSKRSKNIQKSCRLPNPNELPNIGSSQSFMESVMGDSASKSQRKKRQKYNLVTNEIRSQLIFFIREQGMKIKRAAKELGLNYSTAKSIYQVYKNEGRVDKKTPVPKKSDQQWSDSAQEQDEDHSMQENECSGNKMQSSPGMKLEHIESGADQQGKAQQGLDQMSTSDESNEEQQQKQKLSGFKPFNPPCTITGGLQQESLKQMQRKISPQQLLAQLKVIQEIQRQQLAILTLLKDKQDLTEAPRASFKL
eukprot:TRINITY_DN467_c0_g1_i4.p1 TRINITY_DN467_c0_g1~~TRINITY_DN467_c0_g1_i4.p1  ORF type:complete len:307 (-),score=53.76 TRINITY_DN467_c0_g1_i4:168-1088(-)